MKLSDGLFLRCAREVAREYPDIEYKELIVDNTAMQMVMRPEQFDVLLMPNLYGDIISDLAAGLVGGLGIVPGANIGEQYAVFEAVHGRRRTSPARESPIPRPSCMSGAMMLDYLGELDAAARLQRRHRAGVQSGPSPDRRRRRHRLDRGIHRRGDSEARAQPLRRGETSFERSAGNVPRRAPRGPSALI